ncbi:MoaD/ThiS family protein [Leifsonia flava]|uniref:MoaD/ThiS family protein n=1 Tax=Orlajensenia leifsoniae TaxID=2561933 RepID=A0A4Y9R0I3_9MICO|nr:MoaD/ThiS family protein [Leifsonia flava]TFV96866.1 MoaD/ThiS family protein [Leifsonia flava]
MADVHVRYFAAAAEAAGREEEVLDVDSDATVSDLGSALVARYGPVMARVVTSGSFLVDGLATRDPARRLGARVDVLPPFSGG